MSWLTKIANTCPQCGWEMFGDTCSNCGAVPEQEQDPRRKLPSDALYDATEEKRPGLGDRVFEHHGVWMYPFSSAKRDNVEGWYLDWFNNPGSIQDIAQVQVGDQISDFSLNMTPLWKVTATDENSGRIYVEPIEPNPYLQPGRETQYEIEDHDKERIDSVLQIISQQNFLAPNDIAYILLGTVPTRASANPAPGASREGGWYNHMDVRSNRGGQQGMDAREIMMRDAVSLRKIGFDIPENAIDGTMPPEVFKYVVEGGMPYNEQEKEALRLPGEDFNDLGAIKGMVEGHVEPKVKHRNWSAFENIYYKMSDEEKLQADPFIREMVDNISALVHPNQERYGGFDPYWHTKEAAITFAGRKNYCQTCGGQGKVWIDLTPEEQASTKTKRKAVICDSCQGNRARNPIDPNWLNTLRRFEGTTDKDNRRDVAYQYGTLGDIESLFRMEQNETNPKPLAEIFNQFYKNKVMAKELIDQNPEKYITASTPTGESHDFDYHAEELSRAKVWLYDWGGEADSFDSTATRQGALVTLKQYLEQTHRASNGWFAKVSMSTYEERLQQYRQNIERNWRTVATKILEREFQRMAGRQLSDEEKIRFDIIQSELSSRQNQRMQ